MTGTLINAAAVAAGGAAGLLLKRRISERASGTIFHGVALFTLYVGMSMALGVSNPIAVLLSLVAGGLLGEALDLDGRLERLGRRLETRFGGTGGNITRAFVSASLLFCVGPMTILGAVNDGLRGDYTLLLTKSVMDGLSSIAFAATLGPGVLLSILTVLGYQGGITLLAGAVRELMTEPVVRDMTAAGGLMILGIGLNLLGLTRIRVANLLPGLAVAVVLALYWRG